MVATIMEIHRLAAALGVSWPFAGVLRHTGISGTNGRDGDPIPTARRPPAGPRAAIGWAILSGFLVWASRDHQPIKSIGPSRGDDQHGAEANKSSKM